MSDPRFGFHRGREHLTFHASLHDFCSLHCRSIHEPVISKHDQDFIRVDQFARHEGQVSNGDLFTVKERLAKLNMGIQTKVLLTTLPHPLSVERAKPHNSFPFLVP